MKDIIQKNIIEDIARKMFRLYPPIVFCLET